MSEQETTQVITAKDILLNIVGSLKNVNVKKLKKGMNGEVNIEKTVSGQIKKIEHGNTVYNIKYVKNPFSNKIKSINNEPINQFDKRIFYTAAEGYTIEKH